MLTVAKVKALKPKAKIYRVTDGGGLYLEVHPNGSKYWRQKYRYAGKEKRLAHGVYGSGGGQISLAEARTKASDAKQLLADDRDPGEVKKLTKLIQQDISENGFEAVALEWFEKYCASWADSHGKRVLAGLENNIFPWLGNRPCNEINPPELLAVLRRIEARGALETAHRIKQICGQVFRYAIATGRAERDPSQDLKGALPPYQKKHFPTIIEPKKIGELMRAIHGYDGHFVTISALRLAPLVFVRPGELRHAEWSEINFDEAEWRIPAHKMKKKRIHIVPLSRQAILTLENIRPLTGSGKYVFPSVRSNQRPMSDNTLTAALRRMGYPKEEFVPHSFRSMASTILNEHGWNSDYIEKQLAHVESNKIRGAYNHAEYLPERREMMQEWADYLDKLKAGAEIIPLNINA